MAVVVVPKTDAGVLPTGMRPREINYGPDFADISATRTQHGSYGSPGPRVLSESNLPVGRTKSPTATRTHARANTNALSGTQNRLRSTHNTAKSLHDADSVADARKILQTTQ